MPIPSSHSFPIHHRPDILSDRSQSKAPNSPVILSERSESKGHNRPVILSERSESKDLLLPFCLILFAILALTSAQAQSPAPLPWDQNPNGMHIYIWAGLKSHFSGQHDYPQFLADWSKLLTERGAVVDGALHPPSAEDLAHTDVVIIYKGDAGYIGETEKNLLQAYVRRGGGLVSLHDSLCGPDPAYFATLLGGAKKHGEVNYTLAAPIPYTLTDPASPILQGMSNLTLYDEAFYNLTWAAPPDNLPAANATPNQTQAISNRPARLHILATAVIPATPSAGAHKGEVVPQIWTYEHTLPGGRPARAFVSMQGHEYANFSNYQIQQMLLRGIAWAAQKPINELVDYVPPTPPRTNAPAK